MNRKGFTLVELLVVVLIIAILAAIALPLYLSAVADSERKTARANMQTISNAVQAYATRAPGEQFTTDFSSLVGDLGNPSFSVTAGPGTSRTYVIVISPAATTCPDGQGGAVNVSANSFYVSDGVSTDGCYSPTDTSKD